MPTKMQPCYHLAVRLDGLWHTVTRPGIADLESVKALASRIGWDIPTAVHFRGRVVAISHQTDSVHVGDCLGVNATTSIPGWQVPQDM